MAPTNAQIVLAAVQAALDANVPYIHLLTQRHKLKPDLVLRILLTYLPESTEPAAYIPLLKDLNGDGTGLPETLAEESEVKDGKEQPSPEEAEKRVKTIRLQQLSVTDVIEAAPDDNLSPSLVAFLLLRARGIDVETGSLPLLQQLLEPFIEQSAYLKLWLGSTILPLLRLNYTLFPERENPITLRDFEALRGGVALDTLIGGGIGGSTSADDYVRDLKQVVGPWLYGEIYRRRNRQRRPSNPSADEDAENASVVCWAWVNNWLMHIANKQPSVALDIARSAEWSGPGDLDDGGWIGEDETITMWVWGQAQREASTTLQSARRSFVRTCLCLFYTIAHSAQATFDSMEELLSKAAKFEDHSDAVQTTLHESARQGKDSQLPSDFLNAVHIRAHRLEPVELLEVNHPLTSLDGASFSLAAHLLRSARTLLDLGQALPVSKVLHMSLLGTYNEQRVLLQRIVQHFEDKKKSDDDCEEMRTKLFDIARFPKSTQGQAFGVLGQVLMQDAEEVDVHIVRAEVNSARYRHVDSTYLGMASDRLSRKKVEDIVIEVALAAYDNASNGNRTRGGVKKALDIVNAFKPAFSDSRRLKEIEALIRSTHSLSFYKLTLQHGVPCVPVNIRVHPQPLSLIDKVLAQNAQSYAQLDNLVSIAVDLVHAGLIKSTDDSAGADTSSQADMDHLAAVVQRQVTAKAISAALEEGDFDTAYSYIITRLSSQASANEDDDILWRAAYAAGRAPPPSKSGPRHLRRLEQKMELLSQALALAPPSALADVLSTWQDCETQVNEAHAAEKEAEERWNDQGDNRAVSDRHLPGGFGSEAYIPNAEGGGGRQLRSGRAQDEAPMGLFDVARAAGSALQKSAFPLRGAGRGLPQAEADDEHGPDSQSEAQRVRKRDMVSSAVTSGLVSGIGWVIGATPSRES